jgi:sec-independent protein translocase protein TatB
MLHIGMSEILLIAVVAIVVLGPDRLPDLMRTLGRTYGKIRGASQELRQAFQLEVDRVDAEHRADEIRRRREALAERRAAESQTGGSARSPVGGEE